MRLRAPSARERRTIVVAMAIAGAVLLPTRALPAWQAMRDEQRATAVELAADLALADSEVRSLPWLRDSLVARRERYLALAPLLLGGDGPLAPGTALGSLVNGAAAGANLRLASVRVHVDSTSAGGFNRVRATTELSGDIHGLSALLLSMERGPTLLRVSRLAVTQPEPAGPADRPEVLRVELIVEAMGIARRAEAKP